MTLFVEQMGICWTESCFVEQIPALSNKSVNLLNKIWFVDLILILSNKYKRLCNKVHFCWTNPWFVEQMRDFVNHLLNQTIQICLTNCSFVQQPTYLLNKFCWTGSRFSCLSNAVLSWAKLSQVELCRVRLSGAQPYCNYLTSARP